MDIQTLACYSSQGRDW